MRIDELEQRNREVFEENIYWVLKEAMNGEVLDLTEELDLVRKQLQRATEEFGKEILTKQCKDQMESQLEEYRIRVVDLEDALKGTQTDRDGHAEMMYFHSKESGRFR